MSKQDLKEQLHKLIDDTEDEQVLHMLMEELVAYNQNHSTFDDLSDLSPQDRADLEELANEDPEKDTITFEEFKKEMNEWVSKLS